MSTAAPGQQRVDWRTRLFSELRAERTPTVILLVLLVLAGVLIMWAGRRLGFYFDDWTFVITRRDGAVSTFLDPHNGHLSLIPVAVYKALFASVGLEHYWPYRLLLVILHLTCVALVFVLVRRRLGGWAALIPAVLLLFMGAAGDNLLWAFEISQVGAIAAGLGAFTLLDRPFPSADRWASILLVVALACAGMGVPFLLGAAVQVALEPRARKRLWIVALPAALYVLWLLTYGNGSEARASNLAGAPQYVADSASAAAAAIVGLPPVAYGAVLLAGGALGVAVVRRTTDRAPRPSPRLAALLVVALGFWGLTALTRGHLHEPGAPRYLTIGAIALLLIAAEMLPRRVRWTPWLAVITIVVVGFVSVGNVYRIRDATRVFRGVWEPLRGALAGVEVAGASAGSPITVDPVRAPQLQAGPYLAAVRALGSPTGGARWLLRAPEVRQQRADQAIAQVEGIAPLEPSAPERTGRRSGCVALPAAGVYSIAAGRTVSITGAPGAVVDARRFGEGFTVSLGALPASGSAVLRTKADRAPDVPWQVRVASSDPVRICPKP